MCGILLSEDGLKEEVVLLIKNRGKSHFNRVRLQNMNSASSVLSIRSSVEQPIIEKDYSFLFNGEVYNRCESDTIFVRDTIDSVLKSDREVVENKNEEIFKEDKNLCCSIIPNHDLGISKNFNILELIYTEINKYENEMALAILRDNNVLFFKDDIGRRSFGITFSPFFLSSVQYNEELDSMKLYLYDIKQKCLYSKFKPRFGIIKLYFDRIGWIKHHLHSCKHGQLYDHFTRCYDKISDFVPVEYACKKSEENVVAELTTLLRNSIAKRLVKADPVIVFFSGGIDSLIIAILCHLCSGENIKIYLINTAFPDSFDRKFGLLAYNDLVAKYGNDRFLFIENDLSCDLVKANSELIRQLMHPKYTKMAFNICVVLYFSALKASEYGNIVFLGSGADEIFGGYNRYKNSNFRSEMFFDLFTISAHNLCRDDRVIGNNNIEARFPFLDSEIIKFALSLDSSHFINTDKDMNKAILRDLLVELGFERAALVPKKAMQYGAGVKKYESSFNL